MRIGVASGLIVALSACSDPVSPSSETMMSAERPVIEVKRTTLLSQVTGADAPTPTSLPWDVHATDLGHMFWHRGVLYMVFGDTFGEGGLASGKHWRSNALARLAPPDPARGTLGVESMITGADGTARELLPSRKIDGDQMTVIPTNGVSTGDRMYLHYMSVRKWHDPGHWDVGYSGLAYSDDDGETWRVPNDAVWPSRLGFEQVAFVSQAGFVYSFGIPGGRFGDVRLRRVAATRMLELAAHEYWDGARWATEAADAIVVVPGPVGELSVAWNERHRQWMMLYLDPDRYEVMLRLAPELTGPWGPAQTVVKGEEHPGLYAPYIVPLQDLGDEVWFTMSRWRDYNVFLMRMALGPA